MNAHFPLQTWTVMLDYGGAPLVWSQDGKAVNRYVGMLLLDAHALTDFVPEPLGREFAHVGHVWRSNDASNIDWLLFNAEILRLSALLALWVAEFNIMVRCHSISEDTRAWHNEGTQWMNPFAVSQYAKGLPSLQDDNDSWRALLTLYGQQHMLDGYTEQVPTSGCVLP